MYVRATGADHIFIAFAILLLIFATVIYEGFYSTPPPKKKLPFLSKKHRR